MKTKRRGGRPLVDNPPSAAPAASQPRSLWLPLAGGVLVVQLMLAIAAFNPAPHTGGDNATYVSLAHSLLENGTYTEVYDPAGLPHTKYPPVFPALLALWIAAGATTWTALKSTAVLFTAAATVLAFAWAAERRGPFFGAGVAGLFAISSATVDASHWILSEPPFLAFTMLALWGFERAGREGLAREGEHRPASRATAENRDENRATRVSVTLSIAAVATMLAYFTRSAGLPLLLAAAGWLALGRRWRALALFGVGAGVPILLWWLRSRSVERPSYIAEFWMVNPYEPALGEVGIAGLFERFGNNLIGYATRHVPGGIVGAQGAWWVGVLGVCLLALAAWGWFRSARDRPGVAEIFLPLYAGLILIWPEVWSGDRFALPLLPLLFFYAGDALLSTRPRIGAGALVAAAVGAMVLAGPALAAWTRSISAARTCAAATRSVGPFACWGGAVQEFARMAMWSRTALPPGSAVLSRKPTIFYVMSGVPSRIFPFDPDTEVLFAEARATGARYVVIDQWDGQALRFVGEAVARRPGAFCSVGGFDPRAGAAGTLMLGMLLDAPAADQMPTQQISLSRCPPEMLGDISSPIPDYSSSRVPLLSSSSAPAP